MAIQGKRLINIDESTASKPYFRWHGLNRLEKGMNPEVHDKWWYKEEYNRIFKYG